MARDDFKKPIIEALGKRAAYLCTNPECPDPFTSLPHSDNKSVVNVGVAAHIKAASKGGPRYDPNQSATERSSIGNGIWLCQKCAAEIDRDVDRFGAEELLAWKVEHELILSNSVRRIEILAHSGKRPASEKRVAREILDYFSDRRMLFEGYAWEVPSEVFVSVDKTRELLRNCLSKVEDNTPLKISVSSLQDTLFSFLRNAGDLSSRKRLSENDWRASQQFRFALSALRKSCGWEISEIARNYGLSVPSCLKRICPND